MRVASDVVGFFGSAFTMALLRFGVGRGASGFVDRLLARMTSVKTNGDLALPHGTAREGREFAHGLELGS